MTAALSDVTRVAIVDDQPESRKSYGYTVENAEFEPVSEDGPLGSLDEYMTSRQIRDVADAALCDFQLGTRQYATFSGAQLVAHWYRQAFPAILCTRYEKAQIELIRPHRRWIPVLLKPDDLNEETLVRGLESCIKELQGDFLPQRRPWRTQVHFLHQDSDQRDTFIAEVPGWELQEVIRIRLADLPSGLSGLVKAGFRCHAKANLAAETAEDLYLCSWEER